MPRTIKLEVGETFEAEYVGLGVIGKYDVLDMRLDNGELVQMFMSTTMNGLPRHAEEVRRGGFRVRVCMMRAHDVVFETPNGYAKRVMRVYNWALGRYGKDELPPVWVWSRFVT